MAIDQLLKKNFWIVVLPLVAIAALLDAQAITQLVGVSLMPDETQLAAAPLVGKKAPQSSGSARSLNPDPILSRNPFDHVTGSLMPKAEAESEEVSSTIDMSDPRNAPACDGPKVLVIAASSDPDWSLVAFSGDDGKSVLRRRGGEIGGKTVQYVGWDRVWLTSGNTLCQARIFSTEAQAKAAPKPVAPAPSASATKGPGAPALDPALSKGIQRVSSTEFNIDRGVVDKILENQAELMKQARIMPEQENGKVVGIRLYGIRPETLLGTLGMENGDRLQTINGFDMASPEKALEAYARLRTADKLTVQVNRNGKNVNLDYNIK